MTFVNRVILYFLTAFDPLDCPLDCSRPCEMVCPANAIALQKGDTLEVCREFDTRIVLLLKIFLEFNLC